MKIGKPRLFIYYSVGSDVSYMHVHRDRIIGIIDAAITSGELKILRKWETTRNGGDFSTKKPRKAIVLDKGNPSSSSSAKKKSKADSEEQLILQMMANRDRRADAMASICSKYATDSIGKKVKPTLEEYDIPEDEFEKTQSKFAKEKKK